MVNKNIAVILAGGNGSRFGLNMPKQFAKLAGKSIIEHTIEVFETHHKIDEICLVIKREYEENFKELVLKNNYQKIKKIIYGGKERKDSSLSAINAYNSQEYINLIFHDAVRPFLSHKIINDVIIALEKYTAVDVAIPATDTIIKVENNIIKDIPLRASMYQGQTPQAFKIDTIKKAYDIASKDEKFMPTDDCGVVKKYLPNEAIYVVDGSLKNIKITYKQDLVLADKLFQFKTLESVEKLKKKHFKKLYKDKVLVVFGGSYGIGKEIAKLAEKSGAIVEVFSRSTTNTNVASKKDVRNALKNTYKKHGQIDFVVNTASVLIKEPLDSMTYDRVADILNINYLGAVTVAKESIKYLSETNGQLLNFTSSSYTRGRAFYSLYSSTKAAIVNLTQALSEELLDSNIRINCINPQRTATPMRTKNFGKEDPKTLLSAKEVAKVSLATLIMDATGQIVDVTIN